MFEIDLPPLGNNGLRNPALFEQRKFYKNKVFSNPYLPTPLDILYEKPFYGKVDVYGNPVYPSETYMKQLPGEGFITALNFVVDAFTDLKSFLDYAISGQRTVVSDLFKTFVPKGSTNNFHDLYHNHFVVVVFELFVNEYLSFPQIKVKIKTFKDFVNHFVNFCDEMALDFPITKTGFATSTLCPNNISGLFINLADEQFGDDFVNYNKFISNPGFEKYVNAAASYGFYVNKNAPWQIVMNLDSPKATEYMLPYGISLDDNSLFSTYFYKTEYSDYESIKRYLYNSYRIFLMGNEYYEENKTSNYIVAFWDEVTAAKYKTLSTKLAREKIPDTYEEFEKNYGDQMLLEAYLRIRLREAGMKFSRKRIKSEMRKMRDYTKVFGIKGATAHVTTLTKQTKIYEKPPTDEKYPYKIKYFGNKTISGLHAHEFYDTMDKKKNGDSSCMDKTTEY